MYLSRCVGGNSSLSEGWGWEVILHSVGGNSSLGEEWGLGGNSSLGEGQVGS